VSGDKAKEEKSSGAEERYASITNEVNTEKENVGN
jgi:hypothetical protein